MGSSLNIYSLGCRVQHAAARKAIDAAREKLQAIQAGNEGGGGAGEEAAKKTLEELESKNKDLLALTEDEIKTPENIYNNGFLYNLWEVLHPRAEREKGHRRFDPLTAEEEEERLQERQKAREGHKKAELAAVKAAEAMEPEQMPQTADNKGEGKAKGGKGGGKGKKGKKKAE